MIEDIINFSNREKFSRYAELLWDVCQVCPDDYLNKVKVLFSDVKKEAYAEHDKIQYKILSWQNPKWQSELDTNMVQPGDYYLCSFKNRQFIRNDEVMATLFHIVAINEETHWGVKEKKVIYETLHVTERSIEPKGDIVGKGVLYRDYNDSMKIEPFCMKIHDNTYQKISKDVWDKTYNQYKALKELHSELTKDYKDGIYYC